MAKTDYTGIAAALHEGKTYTAIANEFNCARKTISQVKKVFSTKPWAEISQLSNESFGELIYPPKERSTSFALPDMDKVYAQVCQHSTMLQAWQDYCSGHQCDEKTLSYYRFSVRVNKAIEQRKFTVSKHLIPGGIAVQAWLKVPDGNVSVLYFPYSGAAAFIPCPDRSLQTWIDSCLRAFKLAGMSPPVIHSDSLDESGLQSVNQSDQMRVIRGLSGEYEKQFMECMNWAKANVTKAQCHAWCRDGLDSIPFNQTGNGFFSRIILLSKYEAPYGIKYKPSLPMVFDQVKIQFSYHVYHSGCCYSVPFTYYKDSYVYLGLTPEKIIIVGQDGTEIAVHDRALDMEDRKPSQAYYVTNPSHMPSREDERRYRLYWTGDRFRRESLRYGSEATELIDAILSSSPFEQQSFSKCQTILQIMSKYSWPTDVSAVIKKYHLNYRNYYRILAANVK